MMYQIRCEYSWNSGLSLIKIRKIEEAVYVIAYAIYI